LPLTQAEFNSLVEEHGATLYRISYRMIGDAQDAEDVVQETLRSAWKSRSRYKSGHSDRAWLAAILRRRVVDHWRKRKPLQLATSSGDLEVGIDADDPLANDYTDEMQAALNLLHQELRETLLLVIVGELTHQEVADMLKIPLGTVLSRVCRARRHLRGFLTAEKRLRAGSVTW